MTTISIADIQKLAKLSALTITDEQAVAMSRELSEILQYVEQLNAIDTTNVEPTYQVGGLHTVTRPDEIIDYGISQDKLLANAPKQKGAQLEVPRVIE